MAPPELLHRFGAIRMIGWPVASTGQPHVLTVKPGECLTVASLFVYTLASYEL